MQMIPKHIFWPIIDSSSLYAARVKLGQSAVLRWICGRGHFSYVTKMAVTPFYPPWPKTLAICKLFCSIFYRTGVIANCIFLHCGNREFRIFLRKIMKNIRFPICVAKLMQMMPKQILWPIVNCSSLYATRVTCIQGVVLHQFGECGHFQSRDKDGGHTIWSTIAENPLLCANFMALSFMEPELLPIEVLHCLDFAFFREK